MATTRPLEQIIISRFPCLRLCTFGITTTEKKNWESSDSPRGKKIMSYFKRC